MHIETKYLICHSEEADSELLRFFADGLDERISSILTDFSSALSDKISLFLCGSVDEYIALTHKTRETYQSWMVGNSDHSSRTICILSPNATSDYTLEDMQKVAIHELVHLVLDDMFGCPENEAWLAEGIAILYAGQTDLSYVCETNYPSISALSELCKNGETPDSFADNGGYDYAGIYVWYFIKKYGYCVFLQAYQGKIQTEQWLNPGFELEALKAYRKETEHE